MQIRQSVGSQKVYLYDTICSVDKVPDAFMIASIPDVLDQGFVNSCFAHSVAETMQSEIMKISGIKTDLSVLAIYGLWRKHSGVGMFPQTALDLGRKIGTTEKENAPGNLEVPEAIEKAKAVYTAHPYKFTYKIGSFFKVAKEDIKKAMFQFDTPIIVIKGSHAEIAVGWNENGKLILQNSYGKDYKNNGTHECYAENLKEGYLIMSDIIKTPFTDISGHWGEKYIKNAYFAGFLKGRTETTFEPEGTLTRAEAAKLLSDQIDRHDKEVAELEARIEALEEKIK